MKTFFVSLMLVVSFVASATNAAQIGDIYGQNVVLLDFQSAEALFATVLVQNPAVKRAQVEVLLAAVKNDKSATSFCNLAKKLHGRIRSESQTQDLCERILRSRDVLESITTAKENDFQSAVDLNYKVSAMMHMMFLL